jgi:hypothetical protein
MAMAGRGLHAAPPPRPPHHDYFGQAGSNPGNQLYVGNVRSSFLSTLYFRPTPLLVAIPSWLARFEGSLQICWQHHPG